MNSHSQIHEPHKIKTVRLLPFPSREDRKYTLDEAQFNVFTLLASQVTFDMCSHATYAVSQEQLSSQFLGDEAYAGARNFEHVQVAVSEVLGHSYVCPVHNVLGAIKLVLATLAVPGSVVPTNHRTWIDLFQAAGLVERDVRYHQGAVFTGDIDIVLLEESLQEGNVSIVDLQAFADGQHPFSLANLRAVRDITRRHGVRLICNGSRVVENAWYVQ